MLTELANTPYESDVLGFLYSGAIGILFLFISIVYAYNREKIYLYYALFLLFMLLYGFINIRTDTWLDQATNYFFKVNKRLLEPITILSFSAYIFFTVELLAIRSKPSPLYRHFCLWGIVCIIYSVGYYITYPVIQVYEPYIFVTVRLLLFALSIFYLLWIILRIQSPVKTAFVTGSIFYLIGSLVASLRFAVSDLPFEWFYAIPAPSYFEIGIFFETLLFAVALGQRIYHLNVEKQSAQVDFMLLVSNMNKDLEEKLMKREAEILTTQQELRHKEHEMIKARHENELAQSEMLALSLQINPHFLFNCINSITYLIQSGQDKKAIEYLILFSRFIRMVLDNSQRMVIPMEEEIEMLEKYLILEKNRFDNNFSFQIRGAEEPLLSCIRIPPMLLQPLVENAIWHGLMNSPKIDKKLEIDIQANERMAHIIIKDNGIGIPSDYEHNSRSGKTKLGLSLTKERIKLYNYSFENQIEFQISNLSEVDRNSSGTQVDLKILLTNSNPDSE